MKDSYTQTRNELVETLARQLPVEDPIERAAVETAVIVDFAIDEMAENCKRLETDRRGLRRG